MLAVLLGQGRKQQEEGMGLTGQLLSQGEGRWSWAWQSEGMNSHQTPDGNLYCSLLLPWLLRGVFKARPNSHLLCIANHLLNSNSLSIRA